MHAEIKPIIRMKDAEYLAQTMCPADVRELACMGSTPLEALTAGFRFSDLDLRWTLYLDGAPAAMWGCAAYAPSRGCPWLLSDGRLPKVRRLTLDTTLQHVGLMRQRYPYLANAVHAQNRHSLRWLQWAGFRKETEFLARGAPFYVMSLETPHV